MLQIIIFLRNFSTNHQAFSESSLIGTTYLENIALKCTNLYNHIRILQHVFKTLGKKKVQL